MYKRNHLNERVRRAVIAFRIVKRNEEQLARANMVLNKYVEEFTPKEITQYAKETGAIPKDGRHERRHNKEVEV